VGLFGTLHALKKRKRVNKIPSCLIFSINLSICGLLVYFITYVIILISGCVDTTEWNNLAIIIPPIVMSFICLISYCVAFRTSNTYTYLQCKTPFEEIQSYIESVKGKNEPITSVIEVQCYHEELETYTDSDGDRRTRHYNVTTYRESDNFYYESCEDQSETIDKIQREGIIKIEFTMNNEFGDEKTQLKLEAKKANLYDRNKNRDQQIRVDVRHIVPDFVPRKRVLLINDEEHSFFNMKYYLFSFFLCGMWIYNLCFYRKTEKTVFSFKKFYNSTENVSGQGNQQLNENNQQSKMEEIKNEKDFFI